MSDIQGNLSKLVEGQGILGETQGGFCKKRQTVDQLFVVNGVTQLRRSEGKKTWLAFLDMRKAFPSVWREGLWRKMEDYGLGGKFLRVCQNMYYNTRARVRLGGSLSRSFNIPRGLREGCVWSPLSPHFHHGFSRRTGKKGIRSYYQRPLVRGVFLC